MGVDGWWEVEAVTGMKLLESGLEGKIVDSGKWNQASGHSRRNLERRAGFQKDAARSWDSTMVFSGLTSYSMASQTGFHAAQVTNRY